MGYFEKTNGRVSFNKNIKRFSGLDAMKHFPGTDEA